MMHRLLLAFLVLGAVSMNGCSREEPARSTFDVANILADADNTGFARALQPREFHFPDDHGAHPDFRTEWWYFTGNLQGAEGRRFGYELAFFRHALAPQAPVRASRFATRQAYMAHFALTDARAGRFVAFERMARGANGLAGARATPFRVWVENWSVEGGAIPWRVHAEQDDVRIDLELTATKTAVANGDRGLSRKGAQAGNASYYYSLPRLATRGVVTTRDGQFPVTGSSWMDREWSTSALERGQTGWDWYGLQLTDGYELMYYRLRNDDGSASHFSQGTLVAPDGSTRALGPNDVTLDTLDNWSSPRGGRYPARTRLTVKPAGLVLDVSPLLADQELDVSVRYWEGAVNVTGTRNGKPLTGVGYMELTGYATRAAP